MHLLREHITADCCAVRRWLSAFFVLWVLCVPAAMADDERPDVADVQFRGLYFGQAPLADMLCVKGACRDEQQGRENRLRIDFSVYEIPWDVMYVGEIRISSPQYRFFRNRFTEVLFRAICDESSVDACLAAVVATFDREYGLTLVQSQEWDAPLLEQSTRRKTYLTDDGAYLDISLRSGHAGMDYPAVKLYDKGLVELMRRQANPGYRGERSLVPEERAD